MLLGCLEQARAVIRLAIAIQILTIVLFGDREIIIHVSGG